MPATSDRSNQNLIDGIRWALGLEPLYDPDFCGGSYTFATVPDELASTSCPVRDMRAEQEDGGPHGRTEVKESRARFMRMPRRAKK